MFLVDTFMEPLCISVAILYALGIRGHLQGVFDQQVVVSGCIDALSNTGGSHIAYRAAHGADHAA